MTREHSNISEKSYYYVPLDLLVFRMDATLKNKEWCDSKLVIEEQIASMIAELEIASEVITVEHCFLKSNWKNNNGSKK